MSRRVAARPAAHRAAASTKRVPRRTIKRGIKSAKDKARRRKRVRRLEVRLQEALVELAKAKEQLLAEQRRAKAAQRQSSERFQRIMENVSDFIAILDLHGRRVYNSPSYWRILGDAETIAGTDSFNDIHPDDRERVTSVFVETVSTGVGHRIEYRLLAKDGRIRRMESMGDLIRDERGRPSKVIVVSRDVTERNKAEELLREKDLELRQLQKMEAVSRLAGGVAHDFNNLLTSILGTAQILLQQLKSDDPMRSDLQEIKTTADRAAAVTRQLLTFSRKQAVQPVVLDPNELIGGMLTMLSRLIGEDVELSTKLEEAVGQVRVDRGQLEQVIMNLCVNARDAMPDGGSLIIETQNVTLDEEPEPGRQATVAREHVLIAVSDSGMGMDEDTIARVFEPFFTTKKEGTGLGLPIVYGIVKQSGGHMKIYSVPGHGTTFKVFLPLTRFPVPMPRPSQPARAEDLRGSETILIVEDEAAVRSIACRILAGSGYTVLEAARPSDAMWICANHKAPIHLILTDVVMPEVKGPAMAEQILALRPDTRVLFMSGYTDGAIHNQRFVESDDNFISKPFSPNDLLAKIRCILDGAPLGRPAPISPPAQ